MGLKLVFSLTLTFSLGFMGVYCGEVAADEEIPSDQIEELLWIDGKLPPISKTEGKWFWDEDIKQDETIPHTDGSRESLHRHSFITDTVIKLNKDSKITQYVFCDTKNPPSGIMMKFFLEGDEKITVYWEGEEEVFVDADEYITAWYMGPLPEDGEWVGLEIDCKELDITEIQLRGISFITNDGRLWWGRTVVKQGMISWQRGNAKVN